MLFAYIEFKHNTDHFFKYMSYIWFPIGSLILSVIGLPPEHIILKRLKCLNTNNDLLIPFYRFIFVNIIKRYKIKSYKIK